MEECNRLGMLIDLAHCTGDAVTQALAVSKAPMVWSHSSVTPTRQAALVDADRQGAAADAGAGQGDRGQGRGRRAVGARAPTSAATPETYADRLSEMADWLGEDHVAFGTDMNALSGPGDRRLRAACGAW